MDDTIPQNTPSRQCAQCNELKLLTSNNFFRDKNCPEGFRKVCKACMKREPLPDSIVYIHRRGRRGPRIRIENQSPASKRCSNCEEDKPLEQFGPSKSGKYGVRPTCNECRKVESQEFYARRYGLKREPLPTPVNGGKICRRCKVEKPHTQFSPDKRAKDGCNTQCRKCMAEVQLPHTERNRARFREIREREKERYQEKARKWKKANPLKVREMNAQRVAIKKAAQVDGEVDYIHILERDSNWCYICESTIYPEQRIAFDHVIPLVPREGTGRQPGIHAESNIKVTHYLCNARKGNKLLEELTQHDRRGIKHVHVE